MTETIRELSVNPEDYVRGEVPTYEEQQYLRGKMVFFKDKVGRVYSTRAGEGQIGILDPNTGKHIAFPHRRDTQFAILKD